MAEMTGGREMREAYQAGDYLVLLAHILLLDKEKGDLVSLAAPTFDCNQWRTDRDLRAAPIFTAHF
jgi:hypothetical protein